MNSKHAEIILKLMQFLEAHSEVADVGGWFEDSQGREVLHCKFTFRFRVVAAKPKRKGLKK